MLLSSQSPISATSTTGGASATTSATSRWNTVTLKKRFFSKTKSNSCSSTFPSKNFRSPSLSPKHPPTESLVLYLPHPRLLLLLLSLMFMRMRLYSSMRKTSRWKLLYSLRRAHRHRRRLRKVALLATGDALFLLAFSAIGRFSHGLPVLDFDTVRTADPFLAGWFLSAYFLGGYSEDGRGENGRTNATIAAAKSWALGIPLGVAIRTFKVGHIPPSTFILFTMGSTAVFLIGWRTLLHTILPSGQTKGNDDYRRGNPFELFELLTSLVRRW